MPRTVIWVGLIVLTCLPGCAGSARHVMQTSEGGVIAMPSNTALNRKKAEEMMAKRFPLGYVIEREEEVPTGQVTTSSARTDSLSEGLLNKKSGAGNLSTSVNRNTSETHEQTEYRITYRSAGNDAPERRAGQEGPHESSNQVLQTGGVPR
jgi:hypothetical protein